MPKANNLKLLIVGPGAGSNFLASRLIEEQSPAQSQSDLNNEYHSNREYGGIRSLVQNQTKDMTTGHRVSGEVFHNTQKVDNEEHYSFIDKVLETRFPKAFELSRKEKPIKLLTSILNIIDLLDRWNTTAHNSESEKHRFKLIKNRVKSQWRYNAFWRQPHFWINQLETYMGNFEKWTMDSNHRGNMLIMETNDYKSTRNFLNKWNTLVWETHKIENQPLISIEHYLPLFMDENNAIELSKIVNICVVHIDDMTTGYVTDILNMKHMDEIIEQKTHAIRTMSPNDRELKYADVVVNYRKLFYDANPKEIRKLFKFFGREEYFDNNKEKEVKAFHDYHMSNVNFYVDNWEKLSEENV
tara:strand:- start:851 stop:1918 length:1068 start_codon:yes stop_codon:yes gene_type:complete